MIETIDDLLKIDRAFAREAYDWENRKRWLKLPFPMTEYEERITKTRNKMVEHGLDCLLIYGNEFCKNSTEWISGFQSIGGDVIIAIPLSGEPMLTTNAIFHSAPMHSFFHRTWFRDIRPANMPHTVGHPVTIEQNLAEYLSDTGLSKGKIGVEGDDVMPRLLWTDLNHILANAVMVPVSITLQLRSVKSPLEIAIIREAGEATGKGLIAAYEAAQVGARECDIAAEAYRAMSYSADYFTHMMISSGENCGLKHEYPSRRALKNGDMVYVDLGVSYCGYVTDATRTFCVGKAGDTERRLLDCGLAMYEAVVSATKPGVSIVELQDIAIAVAKKAGLLQYHWPIGGFGHGTGCEMSELPRLGWRSKYVLEAGNTFALEPMVTMQGVGCGVVEDIILVTETGCSALTEAPRKLW